LFNVISIAVSLVAITLTIWYLSYLFERYILIDALLLVLTMAIQLGWGLCGTLIGILHLLDKTMDNYAEKYKKIIKLKG
jgi:hypothetical protein